MDRVNTQTVTADIIKVGIKEKVNIKSSFLKQTSVITTDSSCADYAKFS